MTESTPPAVYFADGEFVSGSWPAAYNEAMAAIDADPKSDHDGAMLKHGFRKLGTYGDEFRDQVEVWRGPGGLTMFILFMNDWGIVVFAEDRISTIRFYERFVFPIETTSYQYRVTDALHRLSNAVVAIGCHGLETDIDRWTGESKVDKRRELEANERRRQRQAAKDGTPP